jgi:transposase
MTIPKHRLELPPEAEPARDFIEALVARYESQVMELKQQVQSLTKQFKSLTEQIQKPNPRNSSVPPSSEHPHGKPARKPTRL